MEYATDEYVHPEPPTDGPNVNCVLSWRQRDGEVQIDFRNGWVFDSGRWYGRADARERVIAALRRNESCPRAVLDRRRRRGS